MTNDLMQQLGAAAAKVVENGWAAAMLSLWDAGLWLTRLVLHYSEILTTPDLSPDSGPARLLYQTTYWMAAVLVVVMGLVQMGVSLVRRDGKSLATLLIGTGQFVVMWGAWAGYCAAIIQACAAINSALAETLLRTDILDTFPTRTAMHEGADTTIATVLGLLGLLLWLSAIAHLIVMFTRAAALLVLVATTPIAAAGLVSDVGKAWFWKSVRWFHAAAFTPILITLVMGIGIQLTSSVANGLSAGAEQSIGTALPGVMLILISAVSPLALFKLMAFVDPGTTSGAALRAGLAAQGGLSSLLSGSNGSGDQAPYGTQTDTGADARSGGEVDGEAATDNRIATGISQLGVVGQGLAAGLRGFTALGANAAAVMVDSTNQMGVGTSVYHPDLPPTSRRRPPPQPAQEPTRDDDPAAPEPAAPTPAPAAPAAGGGAAAGEAAAVVV